MTSRSWYDLADSLSHIQATWSQSNDPEVGQKYFSLRNLLADNDHEIKLTLPIKAWTHDQSLLTSASVTPDAVLCDSCHSMVNSDNNWQDLNVTNSRAIRKTYSQLQSSAENGCSLCHLQIQELQLAESQDLLRIGSLRYRFWRNKYDPSRLLSQGRSGFGHGLSLTYFASDGSEIETKNKGILICEAPSKSSQRLTPEKADGQRISNLTGTQMSRPIPIPWTQIRNWISKCEASHELCNSGMIKLQPKTLAPSRLLEICLPKTKSEFARVVRTDALAPSTRYVTLSHCWGNVPFHDFIKHCTGAYFEHITITDIPQLFQDAIAIAVELGVYYLWIDCFCIEQANEQDWLSESLKMGLIYQQAWFNIAASRPSNSDLTIFGDRHLLNVQPLVLRMNWDNDQGTSTKRWMFYSPRMLWDFNIDTGSLASRAWVVQEFVLARRILHFGKMQIFWECAQLRACETCPDGIPGSAINKLSTSPTCLQFEMIRPRDYEDHKYFIWKKIVDRYSACQLTRVTKDKLVALSGLAKSIGAPPHKYLAGLWPHNLEYQLLWRISGPGSRSPSSGPLYQAPSWSWASYNGPVLFRIKEIVNDEAAELLIKIKAAHTETQDDDPTGRVKDGFIDVEAPLALVTSIQFQDMSKGKPCDRINGGLGKIHVERSEYRPQSFPVFCMPVEVKTRKGCGHMLVVGLLLTLTDERPNSFQRAAYFTISDDEGKAEMAEFLTSFRNRQSQPPNEVAKPTGDRTAAGVVFDLPSYAFRIV